MFALVAVIAGTIVTELVDRQSVRFGAEHEDPFLVWVLQGLAPLGQTGLINDGLPYLESGMVGFVLGLAVFAAVTFVVTWLGVKGARSAFAAMLTSWFAVVLGAGTGGLVSSLFVAARLKDDDGAVVFTHALVRGSLVDGYYWGVFFGFFVGLAVLLIWVTGRPRATPYGAPGQATPYAPAAHATPSGQPVVQPSTHDSGTA
ncbi:hypothetical protein [Nocardioides sp. Root151]|uniref:hypothetical protein n=1 Tax=Nocardioides sp. Root151 TaxID=1736475 RepID=UPI0012E347CE|nr:hypothetical protein [Nocardioides sp. Root151]